MDLDETLAEHRDLINALVGTVEALRDDVEKVYEMVTIIHSAQVEHGKALGDLEIRINQCQWRAAHENKSTGASRTPLPRIEAKIGGG